MNNRNKRTFAALLFMLVFSIKMVISVIPIFSMLDAKIAASVIMQLEHETKGEKDDNDKDSFKEKKDFDEHIYSSYAYKPVLLKTNCLHKPDRALIIRLYHKIIPTPPPNV